MSPSNMSPGGNRRDGSESESGDSDESGDDDQGAGGAKDLWKNLCIMPQGGFYPSSSLMLELKQEYQQAQGRLQILWRCKEPIGNVRVMLPDAPHMRFKQDNQVPPTLRP